MKRPTQAELYDREQVIKRWYAQEIEPNISKYHYRGIVTREHLADLLKRVFQFTASRQEQNQITAWMKSQLYFRGDPFWASLFGRVRFPVKAQQDFIQEETLMEQKRVAERRARGLWTRYYSMFDRRHVSEMSGAEFERFVGKLYTRLAYSVSLTPAGADQGVDLILCKDGQKIAVQAKRRTGKVGNKAVQEVIAGKLYYGCSRAMIITNSTFPDSEVALAAMDPTI